MNIKKLHAKRKQMLLSWEFVAKCYKCMPCLYLCFGMCFYLEYEGNLMHGLPCDIVTRKKDVFQTCVAGMWNLLVEV